MGIFARHAEGIRHEVPKREQRDTLDRIRKEIAGLPEEFRRALCFWPVSEVQTVADSLTVVAESIERLGLLPGTF